MFRIVLTEGDSSRVIEIGDRTVVRIGRDPASDVVIRDRFVSARHGEIRVAPEGLRYEDFVTTNGSRIRRGDRVLPVDGSNFHVVPIFPGDEILLGDQSHAVCLRFEAPMRVTTPPVLVMTLPSSEVDATHAETMGKLSLTFDREVLLALHHLTAALSRHIEVDDLLEAFADCVLEAFRKANHVAVYLQEDPTAEFKPAMSRGRGGETGSHPISRTVRDRVLSKGKAVTFDETEEGFDFSDSLHQSSIRSGLCSPLWDGHCIIGMVQVDCRGSFASTPFGQKDLEALAVIAHQGAMALANAKLHANMRRTVEKAIQGLVNALEAKDTYTAGHSEAVADLCMRTCAALGLSSDATDTIRRAALLHDIGKIGVPYHVLNKREALSPEEFRTLKSHVDLGARILEPFEFLGGLVPVMRHHHERWDGRGYPDGLKGDEIPLGARILAVCDTWHSLISHRPYRVGLDHETALAELQRGAGTQFDAAILEVLLGVLRAERHQRRLEPSLVS